MMTSVQHNIMLQYWHHAITLCVKRRVHVSSVPVVALRSNPLTVTLIDNSGEQLRSDEDERKAGMI